MASRVVKVTAQPAAFFYLVRTTVGQERNVMFIAEGRIKQGGIPIKALVCIEAFKGYVLVEADAPHHAERAFVNIKHVRGVSPRKVSLSEIEGFLVPRPAIEGIDVSDVVEVVSGPFKGMRGRIVRIDKSKEEVTLELLEAPYALPIIVHADYVKVVEKKSKKVG
ncbi:MAG: transcription elongation factor Spt5 [Candidatus Nezhaarchaeota archaeon]|nr:transcription elongation factor Spt5 [Candidatus Nezhaarchaeota archaeon]